MKIGVWLKTAAAERDVEELKAEGWQGRLLSERWEDQEVGEECFSWMSEWKTAGAIPATPANKSLPSGKDRDSQKSGCEMSNVW